MAQVIFQISMGWVKHMEGSKRTEVNRGSVNYRTRHLSGLVDQGELDVHLTRVRTERDYETYRSPFYVWEMTGLWVRIYFTLWVTAGPEE